MKEWLAILFVRLLDENNVCLDIVVHAQHSAHRFYICAWRYVLLVVYRRRCCPLLNVAYP